MTNEGGRKSASSLQITESLRQQIFSGRFNSHGMIPTELELCAEYHASRETVRKSIQVLIDEGICKRIPKRGVTVATQGWNGGRGSPSQIQIDVFTPWNYEQDNYYYHAILGGLVAASQQFGVSLAFVRRPPNARLTTHDFTNPTIVWPGEPNDIGDLYQLGQQGKRFVVLSASYEGHDLPCVDCENRKGTSLLVQHLRENGHRRIGVAARHGLSLDHAARVAAANTLLSRGSDRTPVLMMPMDAAEASQTFAAWVRRHHLTAVFALDLEIAGWIYGYCATHQIRLPEDLSLVAFDDGAVAEALIPPLTTVAQPLVEMGVRAVEKLIQAVSPDGGSMTGTEIFETRLIVRSSVKDVTASPLELSGKLVSI